MSGRCIGSDEEVTGVLDKSLDVDGIYEVALPQNVTRCDEPLDSVTVSQVLSAVLGKEKRNR